jgi:hypothetical protein
MMAVALLMSGFIVKANALLDLFIDTTEIYLIVMLVVSVGRWRTRAIYSF